MALYIFSIFLLICCVGCYGNEGCPDKPVDILIMPDGTNHMTQELKDLQATVLTRIITSLPEGSKLSVALVGETISDIFLYKQVKDINIAQSLNSIDRMPALGNVISGPYIQTEIPKYFMDSPLTHNRAEIIILITSNNVGDFSVGVVEGIRKRKTFVIGLGTKELSEYLKEIAANEDHVGFVLEPRDIEDLVNAFKELICKASTYLCDTDNFKIRNINKCIPCSGQCTSTIQSRSASCKKKYCPYYKATIIQYHPPVRADANRNDPPSIAVEDSEAQISNLTNGMATRIGGGIGGIGGFLLLILLLVFIAHRRNWFGLNSGVGVERGRHNRLDSDAVQEEGDVELREIHSGGEVSNDESTGVNRALLPTTEAANAASNDRPEQVVQEENEQAIGDEMVDKGLIALAQVQQNRRVFESSMLNLAAQGRLESSPGTVVSQEVEYFAEETLSPDNVEGGRR